MNDSEQFQRAREFLLQHRTDYAQAYAGFRWPKLDAFNWALDHFDAIARGNATPALSIVDEGGQELSLSFEQLRVRSNQAANLLRRLGVKRGDRLLLMVANVPPLWEAMLAAIKLGAVLIPATTQLTVEDLRDRVERGRVRHVLTDAAGAEKLDALGGAFTRVLSEGSRAGWTSVDRARARVRRVLARRRDPGERPDAALLHLRHDREAEARAPHATRATRSATSRRCTGSGSAPATCTGTSARRAGRSTPGATCSRPGTRAPRCSCFNQARFSRGEDARGARAPPGPDALRAADRVADADPRGARQAPRRPARGGQRGRAAQPRGDRSRPRARGESRSATATGRPRRRARSGTRPGSR